MLLHNLRWAAAAILGLVVSAAGVGVWARQEPSAGPEALPAIVANAVEPVSSTEPDQAVELTEFEDATETEADDVTSLSYGDGKADGKKSISGSGELIQFTGATPVVKVAGVRIHGSRYGQPQAPRESFLIYFLNEDLTRILHTEMVPYSRFERGDEDWVAVGFDHPVELPKSFWLALDFRAAQTKGVYLSFDLSTGGKYSRVGLPGMRTAKVNFGGDRMIQATLAK
jgi:hypothetical protein